MPYTVSKFWKKKINGEGNTENIWNMQIDVRGGQKMSLWLYIEFGNFTRKNEVFQIFLGSLHVTEAMYSENKVLAWSTLLWLL